MWESKKCSHCVIIKYSDGFHKDNRSKSGLQAKCKICRSILETGTRTEYLREYHENTKHLQKVSRKAYQQSLSGKACTKNTKYRRKLKLSEGGASTEEIKNLLIKESICYWCNLPLDGKVVHLDHFYPLSTGGMHEIYNLVVSCASCNMRKSNKDPFVFADEISKIIILPEEIDEW